jgi:hypothetical protein
MEGSAKKAVWYALVDQNGKPYAESNASSVEIDRNGSINVDKFRELVYTKCALILPRMIPSQLLVYLNSSAFENRETRNQDPLKSSFLIDGIGSTEVGALIVMVPATSYHSTSKQQVSVEELPWVESQFNQCLEISKPVSLEEVNVLFKTPSILFGTFFPHGLFIREEFKTVLQIIADKLKEETSTRKVLVLGSPGIGKSVFGMLMFILAVKERKNVALKILDMPYFYFFTWKSNGYEISRIPTFGVDYEGFLDGQSCGQLNLFNCIRPAYLFASPRDANYNQFVKLHCLTVYMNAWSYDECMTFADTIKRDKEECRLRFNLLGGKPRFIFAVEETFETLESSVQGKIPKDSDELKSQIRRKDGKSSSRSFPHILYTLIRKPEIPSMAYLSFASRHIELMVASCVKTLTNTEVRLLLQTPALSLQSWRGKEFEQLLLQDFPTSRFYIRPLQDVGDEERWGPMNAMSIRITSAKEIKNKLRFYCPLSKTFAAIDAVLVLPERKLILYVQSAVSNNHPIKYQHLKNIYDSLSCQETFQHYKHIYLFLVSSDLYDGFKAQSYQSDGKKTVCSIGIKQFVGRIEVQR